MLKIIESLGNSVKGDVPLKSGAAHPLTPCEATIRSHIARHHALAVQAFAGAPDPGYLQLVRKHPEHEGLQAFPFMLGDVEGMTQAALNESRAGFNVYIEGRTIARNTPKGERGKVEHTVGVFALVVDSDDDKGQAGRIDRVEPSLVIESSPGNHHLWLVLDRAVSATEGKPLGDALRSAIGADSDTGVVTQPYRVAGTINYPDARKRARGRVASPTRLLLDNGRLWSAADIRAHFPAVVRPMPSTVLPTGRSGRTDARVVAAFARRDLGDRSDHFFGAVALAVEQGLTPDDCEEIARRYPLGCASKYLPDEHGRGRDRLREQIDEVWRKKLAKDAANGVTAAAARGAIRRLPDHVTIEQIELHQARQIVRAAMQRFLAHDSRPTLPLWQALGAPPPSPEMLTSVQAMAVGTGVGKTRAAIEAVAEYIRELRRAGDERRVVLLVPRHKLGDQIVKDFAALGVRAHLYRGRDALDPDAEEGTKMCLDLASVEAAESIGASVETSCCSGKRPDGVKVDCIFKNRCGFKRQQNETPDVWIGAHEYLFIDKPKAFGNVAKLIIDEGFWQSGIKRGSKGLTLDEIEAPCGYSPTLDADRRKLVQALRAQPVPEQIRKDGLIPVERRVLHDAGLTVQDCQEAHHAEWAGVEKPALYPSMPADERSAVIASAQRPPRYVRRLAALWDAARDLLTHDVDAVSGRLFLQQQATENGRQWVVRTHGLSKIAEGWRTIDTMLLDATLPPLSILNGYFPQLVEVVADVRNVAVRSEYVRTRQVLRAPVAKSRLFKRDGTPVLRNLHALQRYILSRWVETGRGETLVVCQGRKREAKDADAISTPEDWFKANLPKEIAVEHFNNLTGMNDYSRARLVIVIGRVLPGPEEIELMAGAFTGVMPMRASAKAKDLTWYDTTEKLVRKRDGTAYGITVDLKHPDPMVEIMRALVCEAENMQAIGRPRAVNRDASTPRLDIDVLADLELEMPFDDVLCWSQHDEADEDDHRGDVLDLVTGNERGVEMLAAGMILENCADMARCWPEVWKDAKSAENWRASGGAMTPSSPFMGGIIKGKEGVIGQWEIVAYRPAGRGQKTRRARFDPSVVSDPRAWLEARLGTLAHCEIETPAAHAQAAPPCGSEVPQDPQHRDVPSRHAPPWHEVLRVAPLQPSPPPWPGGPEPVPFVPPPNLGPPPWLVPELTQ